MITTILIILAAILVIAGVVSLIGRQWIFGIVLIVLGLLVGPGGASIFGKPRPMYEAAREGAGEISPRRGAQRCAT